MSKTTENAAHSTSAVSNYISSLCVWLVRYETYLLRNLSHVHSDNLDTLIQNRIFVSLPLIASRLMNVRWKYRNQRSELSSSTHIQQKGSRNVYSI